MSAANELARARSANAESGRSFFVPDWPLPAGVHALVTTRLGGVSEAPYDSFNLAMHVGDRSADVACNRALLRDRLPSSPRWMEQVHGVDVFRADDASAAGDAPRADAAVARGRGIVLAVLTADCLPVFFADDAGRVIGLAHAGWRGLAQGVLEGTIARMEVAPATLSAYLGPAIGSDAYEVGAEVRRAFVERDSAAVEAFVAQPGDSDGKLRCDLYALTRLRLRQAGVTRVFGGGFCTYRARERFFSYRRDGRTGRMASLLWRE